jgi:hypothetical protein
VFFNQPFPNFLGIPTEKSIAVLIKAPHGRCSMIVESISQFNVLFPGVNFEITLLHTRTLLKESLPFKFFAIDFLRNPQLTADYLNHAIFLSVLASLS